MKILHYTLGLPPMRSGGLTRYALDLMEEQLKENEVFHLFPGKVDIINTETRIRQNNKIESKIKHFEVINSLPLPLFRGIKNSKDFMLSVLKDIYFNFLNKITPNVIHIHTLMGLHKEFFEAAKNLGIKLVFTTHDYFGICPTINLYKDNEASNCLDFNQGRGCVECCSGAMSTNFLLLTQSSFYPMIKKFKKVLLLNENQTSGNNKNSMDPKELNLELSDEYAELRGFYLSMLNQIDFFHFNSTLAEQVFKSYLPEIKGKVIDITHRGIKKVDLKKIDSDKIRIGYLGPFKEHKGFFQLLDASREISCASYELHLYGDETKMENQENIFFHGKYNIQELEQIFSMLDVLIVPSVWQETFGFVTLEALSHGVPVIVSSNVGSKDLVKEDYGWIYNGSVNKLKSILMSLDKEILKRKCVNLKNDFKSLLLKEHNKIMCKEIYN